VWFAKPAASDISDKVMTSAFGKFSLPQKSEGFDELRYEWQAADKANDYLRTWVVNKKKTA